MSKRDSMLIDVLMLLLGLAVMIYFGGCCHRDPLWESASDRAMRNYRAPGNENCSD